MFWRKAFDALSEWKENYSQEYAVMLEGARRVGHMQAVFCVVVDVVEIQPCGGEEILTGLPDLADLGSQD